MPNAAIPRLLLAALSDIAVVANSPKVIRAKYSGEPKASATFEMAGEKMMVITMPIAAPPKAASVVNRRATPALP
jgi:hypothetical protein